MILAELEWIVVALQYFNIHLIRWLQNPRRPSPNLTSVGQSISLKMRSAVMSFVYATAPIAGLAAAVYGCRTKALRTYNLIKNTRESEYNVVGAVLVHSTSKIHISILAVKLRHGNTRIWVLIGEY